MVVTVAAVGMVQVAVDEVVDVVAVGDGLMTTTWAVDVRGVVACAGVPFRAGIRVGFGYRQLMLIMMVAVGMQQVPVLKEVRVPLVFDGEVSTLGAVFVDVTAVGFTAHFQFLIGVPGPLQYTRETALRAHSFLKTCPNPTAIRKMAACNKMMVAPLGRFE